MPTPFPGIDPYLEQRGLWEQVHTALIVAIQQYLSPLVRPRYRVEIEQRTYLELSLLGPSKDDLVGKPDVLVVEGPGGLPQFAATVAYRGPAPQVAELPMPIEVVERYLEVREVATGDVITVVELLSPSNKRPGEGRKEYEAKRLKVLGSWTNLIEIDLIRAGKPMPMRLHNGSPGDYRIVIGRAYRRPHADVFAFTLRDPIPDFPVPLLQGEPEPTIPLNQLLHDLYDRAGYDLAVDYRRSLDPPLSPEDQAWVQVVTQAVR